MGLSAPLVQPRAHALVPVRRPPGGATIRQETPIAFARAPCSTLCRMGIEQIATVTLGALAGGFVSGLAGFGTGLTAMGIWLHAVPPAVAASLVIICSVVSQLQTIRAVWHAITPRRVLPFILPGLAGVPVGTMLLGVVDPSGFRISIGVLLLGFALFQLFAGARLRLAWGGRALDMGVGLASGVLGGLAGLSGVLLTVLAALRGWGKDERRGLFQAFNLSILLCSLGAHAVAGRLDGAVGLATVAALPGTLAGAWLGARVYRRLSDQRFNDVILVLLAFSGLTLILAG